MRASTATAKERLAAIQSQFEATKAEMEAEAKKAGKLESKFTVLTQGLQNRERALREQLQQQLSELQEAKVQLQCFQYLQQRERQSVPQRLHHIKELADHQKVSDHDPIGRLGTPKGARGPILFFPSSFPFACAGAGAGPAGPLQGPVGGKVPAVACPRHSERGCTLATSVMTSSERPYSAAATLPAAALDLAAHALAVARVLRKLK